MKRLTQSKLFRATAAAAGAFMLIVSSMAFAQITKSPAERRLELSSAPDVVYLFEDERKQVVDYKSDHMFRVCVSENRHLVPLTVIYDNKRGEVKPGDCLRFEAKQVELTPAETLESNWIMRAEVETIS